MTSRRDVTGMMDEFDGALGLGESSELVLLQVDELV